MAIAKWLSEFEDEPGGEQEFVGERINLFFLDKIIK